MKTITSIAPGKIILTGEHSVVYGQPALIAAVNREVRVEIGKGEKDYGLWILSRSSGISHNFKVKGAQDYGNDNKFSWRIEELVSYWQKAHSAWKKFIELGEKSEWEKFSKDPSVVVKASLGLVYGELKTREGVSLKISSTIPVGSGMGSSASVAVAIIGGLGDFLGVGWSRGEVYERAFKIEQIVHGRASGADPTAVTYGGLVEFVKIKEEKNFKFHPLPQINDHFCLIDSGKPSETTGEMVSIANSNIKSQKSKYIKIIEKIGRISHKVIDQVKRGKLDFEWVEENERLLEELGVVGERAKSIVIGLKMMDVRAKICGAGGVKTGSGMILAYNEDSERLEYALDKIDRPTYQITLGVEGWHIA